MVRPNVPGLKAAPAAPAATTTPAVARPLARVSVTQRSKEALAQAKESVTSSQSTAAEDPASLIFEPTGLGKLPDMIQSSTEMDKRRKATWDTYDEAVEDLHALGLPIEQSEPSVPCPYRLDSEDILTEDSRAFTEKYAECLAWEGYLKTIHARLSAQVLQAEHEEKVLKAEIRGVLTAKNSKIAAKALEDGVLLSLDYQAAASRLQKLNQELLMVKSMVDQQTANLRVLSRQVTINGQELEAEAIKNNLGSRGRAPTPTGSSPPLLGASKFSQR